MVTSNRKCGNAKIVLLKNLITTYISGDCAFNAAVSGLFNRLPERVKSATPQESFKSLLKTHLFKIVFQDL